jgi:prolyl-tRNA synthetase
MINLYKNFVNYFLCIPVIMGEKTIGERFAGAQNTFTIEAIMQDGQMLQCGTSHYLGENFARPYEIKYQTKNNDFQYIHQTSAGVSTRLIGAIIMSHSDDKGLVLPIGVAFNQIAILPILSNKNAKVNDVCKEIYKTLHNKYRVFVDESDNGMGYKIANQEVCGTPLCIVIGPNDVQNNVFTLIRRDDGVKQSFKINDINNVIENQINLYQQNIYNKALERLNSSIVDISSIDEFNAAIKNKKIIKAYWGGNAEDEQKLKHETGASPRCIFKKIDDNNHKCFYTNKQATHIVYFARAY